LDKQPAWFVTKGSDSEEEVKALIHSGASKEKMHSKEGGKLDSDWSPGLMTVEQIQDLVANTLKAQLGGHSCEIHLYIKPYTQRVGALCMPCNYKPQKF